MNVDHVATYLAACVVLTSALALGLKAALLARQAEVREIACASAAALARLLPRWGRKTSAGPEAAIDRDMQQQVAMLVQERRSQVALYTVWVCWVAGLVRGIEGVQRAIDLTPVRFNSVSLLFMQAVLLVLVTIFGFAPRLLVPRTLPVLHVLSMLTLSLAVSPVSEFYATGLVLWQGLFLVFSLCISFMCLRFWIVALSNTVLSVCFVVGFAYSPKKNDEVLVSDIARVEICVLLFKLVILHSSESLLRAGARKEVEAQLGKCQRSAVMSLLGMMCDSVVDLDTDLCFKEHPHSFQVLLMCRNGRCLKGTPLSDFIADSDEQQVLLEKVKQNCQADEGRSSPGMFAVRLRDSFSKPVSFWFYHVPYRGITGAMNHLIGLREDSAGYHATQGFQEDTVADLGRGPGATRSSCVPTFRRSWVRGGEMPEAALRREIKEQLDALRSRAALRGSSLSGSSSVASPSSRPTVQGGDSEADDADAEMCATRSGAARLRGEHRRFGELLRRLAARAEEVRKGHKAPGALSFGCLRASRAPNPGGSAGSAGSVSEGLVAEYPVKVHFPPPPENQGANYLVSVQVFAAARGVAMDRPCGDLEAGACPAANAATRAMVRL